MQLLDGKTEVACSDDECAALVIEMVLLGMKTIRGEMRSGRPEELSVPQFRVLAYLKLNEGASLSEVAEHIGLTLPSMSRAVDGLVKRGFVTREVCSGDRRRVLLALTERGDDTFESAREATRSRIAGLLSGLSAEDRVAIVRGVQVLRSVFASENPLKQVR